MIIEIEGIRITREEDSRVVNGILYQEWNKKEFNMWHRWVVAEIDDLRRSIDDIRFKSSGVQKFIRIAKAYAAEHYPEDLI